MRLFILLGVLTLLSNNASGQSICDPNDPSHDQTTYFPDPTTFPFPLTVTGTRTFTFTYPDGTVKIVPGPASQTILFANPRDLVNRVFNQDPDLGDHLFHACDGVFPADSGRTGSFQQDIFLQKVTIGATA